ncbi:formylglycine-generating enzyme family protein [candidate division WOR-3 bacterium]|nr:formylglycine-generating enzyme family protein [candidate division WOR-3 bacterium]
MPRRLLFFLAVISISFCTKKTGTEPEPQPQKRLTVVFPNQGNFLYWDSAYAVTWYKEGDITSVDVSFRVNDDSPWVSIGTGLTGLSCQWTIPKVRTSKAKIKITDSGDSTVFDTNEGYFIIDKVIENELVLIVCDSFFLMGSDTSEPGHCPDEDPVHSVCLSSFYVSKREVRNAEYRQFCDFNAYQYPPDPGFPGMSSYFDSFPDYPVVMVSWFDAARFCNWLSLAEGYEAQYDTLTWQCRFTGGYRLPTEAEWEYLARGGLESQYYPWGNQQPTDQCNWSGDPFHEYTAPVVSYDVNGFGLYNTAGNVWEWCNDFYADDYYSSSPFSDPRGPQSGSFRVIRGGSWFDSVENVRCAKRGPSDPSFSDAFIKANTLGFRIVLGL